MNSDDADRIIRGLNLAPHPEGGHFRETFRDTRTIAGRAHSTAIYYLLRAEERSRWHRIDAAEIWHWYAGAPLSLQISANGVVEDRVLGSDIANGEAPQIVVPAKAWQCAQTLGHYTLAGCTVAPGFLFDHFEVAPDDKVPE